MRGERSPHIEPGDKGHHPWKRPNEMKLGDLWRQYEAYTGEVSKGLRTLALAAGGFVWILRRGDGSYAVDVYVVLLILVIYFVLDIAQYISGAIVRKGLARQAEVHLWTKGEKFTYETEVPVPAGSDRTAYVLWWSKVIVLLLAYVVLGHYMVCKGMSPVSR